MVFKIPTCPCNAVNASASIITGTSTDCKISRITSTVLPDVPRPGPIAKTSALPALSSTAPVAPPPKAPGIRSIKPSTIISVSFTANTSRLQSGVSKLTRPAPALTAASEHNAAAPVKPGDPAVITTLPASPLWQFPFLCGSKSQAIFSVNKNFLLSIRSKSILGIPISATIISPLNSAAGYKNKPGLASAIVTVISACTAFLSALPVSALTPLGTSMDTTGTAILFIKPQARCCTPCKTPLNPVPKTASITKSAWRQLTSATSQLPLSSLSANSSIPHFRQIRSCAAASPVSSCHGDTRKTFTRAP